MTTSELLLADWEAIAAAGPARAGGKAFNLARLARYGFPVPRGLCIPADVHEQWLQASGLRPALLQLCDAGEGASPAQWQALRTRLAAVPAPVALVRAWQAAVRGPAAWAAGSALAVRSSSPQEDSAQASFAGIHHSLLNVPTLPPTESQAAGPDGAALWRAVVAVWCSLWTPTAAAYRTRMGLAHAQAHMAVLVMPQVAAQASGIGFTHEPATGRSDRLLIHANWGLGESLVGGQARGDEIVLASTPTDHRMQWVSQRIGEKQQIATSQPGGGTRLEVPDAARRAQPVLTREQALQLGGLLQQAALALDWERPAFDCEWAWDGRAFWLLQARPITALPQHTYAALRGQPQIYSRGNVREISPFPLQPYDWSASQAIAFPISDAAPRTGGFSMPPALPRLALRHGYLYLNMSLMQWESWAAYAMSLADFNRMIGGHHGEVRVPAATWRTQLQRAACFMRYAWRAPKLRRQGRRQAVEMLRRSRAMAQETLPAQDAAVAGLFRARMDWFTQQHGVVFMQGSAGASMWMLVQLIERYLPGQGHALASAMLAGGAPSVTAQQSLDLAALARVARDDAPARAWLQGLDGLQDFEDRHPPSSPRSPSSPSSPSSPDGTRITAHEANPAAEVQAERGALGETRPDALWASLRESLPADNPFRQAFATLLERYGHRATYETYNRHPRWREAPGYLLQQLPGLMAVELQPLRDAAPAQHALAQARRAMPWWQALRLKPLAAMARQEFSDRECARSAVMSAIEPARQALLALGERWVARGWLSRADDTFFLTLPEQLAALDGARPGPGLRALADDRLQQFEQQCAQTDVPDVLLEGADEAAAASAPFGKAMPQAATPGATPGGTDEAINGATHGATLLHGVCVGRGVARGRACLMHAPQEGARLRAGDILIVPSTDPSWTPLFLKVGGLVMETGGFLSHGAIVAREFGIPAVVNVPGVMRRAREGQGVEVDAARATVRLLAPASAPMAGAGSSA